MAFQKLENDIMPTWYDAERGYQARYIVDGTINSSQTFNDCIWFDIFNLDDMSLSTRFILDVDNDSYIEFLIATMNEIEEFFSHTANRSERGIFFATTPSQIMAEYSFERGEILIMEYDFLFLKCIESVADVSIQRLGPAYCLPLAELKPAFFAMKEVAKIIREDIYTLTDDEQWVQEQDKDDSDFIS